MSFHESFSLSLNRRDLLAWLALLGIVLLFFWKLAFTNLIIARGDIFYFFYPYRDYAAQAVREGRIPLWNPYLFMGAPFIANSQAGFFYPLNLAMSWLDTTRAINWTIVLHIFIAASGAYAFGRSRLGLSIAAAWLAAISFGLGGYIGTQIEHVNQLQGLAWLGWIFLAYEFAVIQRNSKSRIQHSRWIPLAILLALQLLAGHTQSVYITLIGLGTFAVWPAIETLIGQRSFTASMAQLVRRLWPLMLAAAIAVALSALQLLPTLELTRQSARSGGLPANLAVSFSLDPRLLGRTLLPDYESALPAGGEFTAFLSVTILMLIAFGLASLKRANPQTRAIALVAGIGLLLATGGYDPLYYLLLKFPGFDLFRAPARWIVLFVFSGSLIAGVGLDALRARRLGWRTLAGSGIIVIVLIGLTFLSAGLTPAGASGPLGRPSSNSLLLWLGALLIASVLTFYALRFTRYSLLITFCLFLLVTVELFFATRPLTYNSRATAPDALMSLRPPETYLMVAGQAAAPPDRFLSISDIRFDPGDKTELQAIFGDQLSEEAFYDLIVATKAKEILAPNLPLYYRVPAVDGYDGGVLPLRNYIEFQRLFLDPTLIQTDGRLREQLKSIPAARWLDLMNARYIITDKVGDQWYDNVLYDLQFETKIAPGQTVTADTLPPFKADALGLVYSEPGDKVLADVEVTFADGSMAKLSLTDEPAAQVENGRTARRLKWDQPKRVKSIRLTGAGGFTLHGAALIDSASGAFQPFVVASTGQFQLAHSGDVKIYENLSALPRAFVVSDARVVPTDDAAIQLMQTAEFDPGKTVVLIGENETESAGEKSLPIAPSPRPSIVSYSPEHVAIDVNASQDEYLVLTDADYPGWTATVDGQPAEIVRADILFRAVPVTAGQHRVELRYQSQTFALGLVISIGTVIGLIVWWFVNRLRIKRRML